MHNLSLAVDVDAKLARLEERSRHVQINDESLCDSCHARLGTKLFAMYPDDTIVCYKVCDIDLSHIILMWMNFWNAVGILFQNFMCLQISNFLPNMFIFPRQCGLLMRESKRILLCGLLTITLMPTLTNNGFRILSSMAVVS